MLLCYLQESNAEDPLRNNRNCDEKGGITMGYFSNGEEGDRYDDEYCSKCIHAPDYDASIDCAVLTAHSLHNYDECNKPESILHLLIPREGLFNGKCKMFIEKGGQVTDKPEITTENGRDWPK